MTDEAPRAPLDERLLAAGRAMHDAHLPAPDLSSTALAELVQDLRDDWQLTFDDDLCAWVAVQRPTPAAMHVVVAFSVAEMRDKITKIREGE
jgi:hypothetical protein